jgi:hypothetical protein
VRGKLYIFYAAHIPFAPPTFTSCTQVVSFAAEFFSKCVAYIMLEVKQEVIRGNGKVLFRECFEEHSSRDARSLPECKGMLWLMKLCCKGHNLKSSCGP